MSFHDSDRTFASPHNSSSTDSPLNIPRFSHNSSLNTVPRGLQNQNHVPSNAAITSTPLIKEFNGVASVHESSFASMSTRSNLNTESVSTPLSTIQNQDYEVRGSPFNPSKHLNNKVLKPRQELFINTPLFNSRETPAKVRGPKGPCEECARDKEVRARLNWQLRDQIQWMDKHGDDYRNFLKNSETSIVGELRRQIQEFQQRNDVLQNEKNAFSTTLAQLRSDLANSKQQNKKLNEQLNSEKDKDDSELQELKRTLNQKRTELTESNSKKTALAKKAKELEETAGNDKKKIEDLQIKYKKSCDSNQKLRMDLDKLKKEKEDLQTEFDKANQQTPRQETRSRQPTASSAAKRKSSPVCRPILKNKNVSWNQNLEERYTIGNDSMDSRLPPNVQLIRVETYQSKGGTRVTRTKMEDECVLYKTGDEKETFVCLGAFEASITMEYPSHFAQLKIDDIIVNICFNRTIDIIYGEEGSSTIFPDGRRIERLYDTEGNLKRIEEFQKNERYSIHQKTGTEQGEVVVRKMYSKRHGSSFFYSSDSFNYNFKSFQLRFGYFNDSLIRIHCPDLNVVFDLFTTGRFEVKHVTEGDEKRLCYHNGYPEQPVLPQE